MHTRILVVWWRVSGEQCRGASFETRMLLTFKQVDELIAAQQLDLTEDEYALLIGVCAHGAAWERAEAVLTRIARELTTLQEGTLAAAERFFRWGWPNQHTKYES